MKKIKKWLWMTMLCVALLLVCGCSAGQTETDGNQSETNNEADVTKWDCSVVCTKESQDGGYVVTYSDEEVTAKVGMLMLENQNRFPVSVHLSAAGLEEQVFDLAPSECTVYSEAEPNIPYTVGLHADVAEGTEIRLMIYDVEQ